MNSYSLSSCEKGHIDYQGVDSCPARNQPNCVALHLPVRSIIVIILFNMCVLLFGYLVFKYTLNTLEYGQKAEIFNYFCSLAGFVIIICMLLIGDMSKNNPHIYYI